MDPTISRLLNHGNSRQRQEARILARGGRHPSVQKAVAAAKAASLAIKSLRKDGDGGGAGGGAASPTGTGFSSGGAPMTSDMVYTPTGGGTSTRRRNNNVQTTKPRDSAPHGSGGGMG